jgi:hypothetical protein
MAQLHPVHTERDIFSTLWRYVFTWYSPNKRKYVLTRRYFGEEPIYLYSDIPFEE